jgi:hypothetical protein
VHSYFLVVKEFEDGRGPFFGREGSLLDVFSATVALAVQVRSKSLKGWFPYLGVDFEVRSALPRQLPPSTYPIRP